MKGSDIVRRARIVLHDAGMERWYDDELVDWINDGCRYIALQRPDACAVNQSMTLASGTKQSIAALHPPGMRLLDGVRNEDGHAITLVDRHDMDMHRPSWHADPPGPTVHYIFDNRDPKIYYVWPPAVAGAQIDVIYARAPAEVTVQNLPITVLPLDDLYADALLSYVLFRCYVKDAEATHNAELASLHLQACNAALGAKAQADAAASPDLNSPSGKIAAGVSLGGQ